MGKFKQIQIQKIRELDFESLDVEKISISVRVPRELARQLDSILAKNKITKTRFFIEAIKSYLNQNK